MNETVQTASLPRPRREDGVGKPFGEETLPTSDGFAAVLSLERQGQQEASRSDDFAETWQLSGKSGQRNSKEPKQISLIGDCMPRDAGLRCRQRMHL